MYNGNLLENDRIDLVAHDIVDEYSFISFEKARDAAMLEGRITDYTVDDKLNRLYNIMLVNSDDKRIVSIIYMDFLKLLSKNLDSKYTSLIDDMNLYFNNLIEFPIISE